MTKKKNRDLELLSWSWRVLFTFRMKMAAIANCNTLTVADHMCFYQSFGQYEHEEAVEIVFVTLILILKLFYSVAVTFTLTKH